MTLHKILAILAFICVIGDIAVNIYNFKNKKK